MSRVGPLGPAHLVRKSQEEEAALPLFPEDHRLAGHCVPTLYAAFPNDYRVEGGAAERGKLTAW